MDKEALNTVDKEVLESMHSQEVISLVSTPRNPPASGDGLRGNLENFELLSRVHQIAKISDLPSLQDLVVLRRIFKTTQDVDDGFGGFSASMPRIHSSST